jgi:hypothetical protein
VQTGNLCAYSCLADFHDLDGDRNAVVSDGCEYACTFISLDDDPDLLFSDDNCDGIDGTVTQGIFVATSGDNRNDGTPTAPLATLQAALDRAGLLGRPHVYVAGGSYTASTLILANGVHMYSGYTYSPSGSSNWSRNNSSVANFSATSPTGATATNITSSTVLDRMNISAGNGTVAQVSSYGLIARNSAGLVLRNLTVRAGNGRSGVNGSSVFGQATAGGNGSAGVPGCEDSSGFCDGCGRPGGGGGCLESP